MEFLKKPYLVTFKDLFCVFKEFRNYLNLFTYCANNPIMYVDPSGNTSIPADWGWLREVDGPYPYGDLAYYVILGGSYLYSLIPKSYSISFNGESSYDTSLAAPACGPHPSPDRPQELNSQTSVSTPVTTFNNIIINNSIPMKYPWNDLPTTGEHSFEPPTDKAGNPVLKKGPHGGIMDKNGNEWTWDKEGVKAGNPHWDVQHKNGTHTNVNPDSSENAGEVNHGKDNFKK